MKFKEITIENFKGIKGITYTPLNKTAVLVGKNGLGKTSFLEGIRFLITGNTPDNCIFDGADSTTVSGILEDDTNFSRMKHLTKPSKVTVNGKATPAKNLDSYLETLTGVKKDAMKITTSAEIIEGLSSADFGDFIMGFIPEEIDFSILCGYIPGLTPEGEIELSMIFPPMPEKFGIDKVKAAYNYFFDLRKNTKKEIDIRNAKISTFRGEEPKRSLKDIEEELSKLLKLEGGQEAAKTAIRLYDSAVANKKKAEAELASLLAQISAITATKPVPSELTTILSKKEICRKNIVAAEKIKQTLLDNILLFENTIVNLGKPVCPLSEKLVCTTDKTQVREELLEMITSNREGIEIQEQIIKDNNDELSNLEKLEKRYRENETEYNKKVLLNSRYESAKKSIPVLPAKPEITEIRDYKDDIKQLQKERDAYTAYQQHTKNISELEFLQKRLDLISSLIKALEPKGCVMNNISDHYMSTFETVINSRAATLRTGFNIKFIAEDGVKYLVQTDAAKGFREYTSLSHGEQTLAMFLILDMLNELTGAKLLLLDDLNHLDKTSFEELFNLVQSPAVQDSYDHIFLCSVNNKDITDVIDKHKNVDFVF